MKKNTTLLLLFVIANNLLNAQIPSIQWQKKYGGSNIDYCKKLIKTNDGGYIAIGSSFSSDTSVTANYGIGDYWVVKIDSLGSIQWQKNYGGTDYDDATCIKQTKDSGYIIGGFSFSGNMDITNNYGAQDYWVAKLDKVGTIQWQKNYGGSNFDILKDIIETDENEFILAGNTMSNDADVTQHYPLINGIDYDIWLVKIDNVGTIQWQKNYGGSSTDEVNSIIKTNDGNFVFCGTTSSPDYNVTGLLGTEDAWVVKINSAGNILWNKCIGTANPDGGYAIKETSDSGLVIAGYTAGNLNNPTGHHGNYDGLVAKLNKNGTLVWQKYYGGSQSEYITDIQQTSDNGFAFCAYTNSNDYNVTSNHGQDDFWVVKIDSIGTIQWQKAIGGSNSERPFSINTTTDGGFIVAGQGESANGDATINYGIVDYWIVKLHTPILPIKLIEFTAKKNNNEVVLNWKTANEEINTKFNMQRSEDGINYKTIAVVHSNNSKNYSFIDKNIPSSKTIFYRIEAIENNGEKTYSNIKSLNISNANSNNSVSVGLYPNPNNGKFTIKYSSNSTQSLQLKVVEVATGRVACKKWITPTKGNNTQPVALQSNIANGVYNVTLNSDTIKYNAVKLVISK